MFFTIDMLLQIDPIRKLLIEIDLSESTFIDFLYEFILSLTIKLNFFGKNREF